VDPRIEVFFKSVCLDVFNNAQHLFGYIHPIIFFLKNSYIILEDAVPETKANCSCNQHDSQRNQSQNSNENVQNNQLNSNLNNSEDDKNDLYTNLVQTFRIDLAQVYNIGLRKLPIRKYRKF
jgi:hypothetical protein